MKVIHDFLAIVDEIVQAFPRKDNDFSLWIPCGHRFDLISNLMDKFSTKYPKRGHFLISVGNEEQRMTTKPVYAIHAPLQSGPEA